MKVLLTILFCLVSLTVIILAASCRRSSGQKPGEAAARLKSHLAQEKDYRVYVGVPLGSPTEWKQAVIEGQALSLSGEHVEIEEITAFLVVYANGEVLDAEKPFLPLPDSVHFVEPKRHPRRDLLDPSKLSEGTAFVRISFGASVSRPNESGHYSTAIQNISDTKIRVLRFAAYTKSGNTFQLNTISGDFFSADEFINWYGVAKDGWIQPGQTVTDPNNYGGGEGYWVYYCETEGGKEFATGARIPE